MILPQFTAIHRRFNHAPRNARRNVPPLLLLIFLAAFNCLPAQGQSCANADLVVRNARIVTMDASDHIAEAFAVRDGRITAIGTVQQIAACVSASTRVIDAQGRTILPGLIDIHTHAMEWAKGIVREQIDAAYPAMKSIASLVTEVAKRSKSLQPGEWISGAGWDDAKYSERRYVTRQDLDPLSGDHPVYLIHVSGHLAAVNSVALKLAGISRTTPDPSGGVIEHDSSGEPTGILKDNAMDLVAKYLPPDPADLPSRAAKYLSAAALSVGLTTIHDISLTAEDLRGYQQAELAGTLKIRVHMVPLVRNIADAQTLANSGLYTGFGNDRLRIGAAKMFADGGMGARTIAIYPPPVAGEPDNFGLLIWKPDDMQKAHHILATAGWPLVGITGFADDKGDSSA